MNIDLTSVEVGIIIRGLRIAAVRFDGDARVMEAARMARLAEQFKAQASNSRQLADNLEEFA